MAKKEESNVKKIANIVVMAIEIIIIIFGMVLSIVSIQNSQFKTKGLIKGLNLTVVLSDSMEGNEKQYKINSFNAGDALFIKAINEKQTKDIKVGDVVTYVTRIRVNGELSDVLVSHRVVEIIYDENGNIEVFATMGDKEVNIGVPAYYEPKDIKGVVIGVIPKFGNLIIWFQKSTNFLLTIVIPLALLLIYNLFIFIRQVMAAKLNKVEEKNKQELEEMKAALKQELLGDIVNENANNLKEEEIKKKAIEEYLEQLKQNNDQNITQTDLEDK